MKNTLLWPYYDAFFISFVDTLFRVKGLVVDGLHSRYISELRVFQQFSSVWRIRIRISERFDTIVDVFVFKFSIRQLKIVDVVTLLFERYLKKSKNRSWRYPFLNEVSVDYSEYAQSSTRERFSDDFYRSLSNSNSQLLTRPKVIGNRRQLAVCIVKAVIHVEIYEVCHKSIRPSFVFPHWSYSLSSGS